MVGRSKDFDTENTEKGLENRFEKNYLFIVPLLLCVFSVFSVVQSSMAGLKTDPGPADGRGWPRGVVPV